jgi:hypothetical protein
MILGIIEKPGVIQVKQSWALPYLIATETGVLLLKLTLPVII